MLIRLREWWESLGRNNQIVLVASSLGGLVALIGFVAWASTPEYVPLFSNLGAADATAITQKLKDHNVPYKLAANGTSIEVPAQNHDEMQMTLVGEGLPQQANATPGYELLEKTNSFSTQPMEALMMMRAKEGEIAKSIMTMQQISSATVHFANADDTPFTRDKHDASASIILAVKPGQSLSDENVHAIVRLTQMSFTGLNEKSISVVDGQGDLLFDGTRATSATGDEQIKREHSMAQVKRNELQSLLDSTIGPHKAVVLVNVELSSDSEATETDYQPGAVISQQSDNEVLNGPGVAHGNQTGVGANIPNPANPAGGASPTIPTYVASNSADGKYIHDTVIETSQPSVIHTNTQKLPGRVEKLTVSALVDTKVPAGEVTSITDVLKTAIGFDPADVNHSRSVTVAQVPFDRSAEDAENKASAAARSSENMARMVSIFVPLGLMALCLFLLARALRKPKVMLAGGQLALAGGGGAGGGMGYAMDASGQMIYGDDGLPMENLPTMGDFNMLDENGQVIGLSKSSGPNTYDVISENFDANLESILHMTKSKPETVAMLIKSWISEDVA